MLLTIIFNEIKHWWVGDQISIITNEEFDHIESKHNRVLFDVDICEMIRVR